MRVVFYYNLLFSTVSLPFTFVPRRLCIYQCIKRKRKKKRKENNVCPLPRWSSLITRSLKCNPFIHYHSYRPRGCRYLRTTSSQRHFILRPLETPTRFIRQRLEHLWNLKIMDQLLQRALVIQVARYVEKRGEQRWSFIRTIRMYRDTS